MLCMFVPLYVGTHMQWLCTYVPTVCQYAHSDKHALARHMPAQLACADVIVRSRYVTQDMRRKPLQQRQQQQHCPQLMLLLLLMQHFYGSANDTVREVRCCRRCCRRSNWDLACSHAYSQRNAGELYNVCAYCTRNNVYVVHKYVHQSIRNMPRATRGVAALAAAPRAGSST